VGQAEGAEVWEEGALATAVLPGGGLEEEGYVSDGVVVFVSAGVDEVQVEVLHVSFVGEEDVAKLVEICQGDGADPGQVGEVAEGTEIESRSGCKGECLLGLERAAGPRRYAQSL